MCDVIGDDYLTYIWQEHGRLLFIDSTSLSEIEQGKEELEKMHRTLLDGTG